MTSSLGSLPVCRWEVRAELGEGPVWVPDERAVYFVDIFGHHIHRWDESGGRRTWRTPAAPGFVVPCRDGSLICGLRGALHRFDPVTAIFESLLEVEQDKPAHRLNDGFVDASGRLWFGTMHEDARTPGGALYSLEPGGMRLHDSNYVVTNGPALSPDGRTLYHSDSGLRSVYAFRHDSGTLSDRHTFVTLPEGSYPDGMAVDSTGGLWIAIFNGWRIERYAPDGRKLSEIPFPCANVTKPVFGGPDLRTLYVTTAWTGLSPDDRRRQPLAGALFSVPSPVAGLPPRAFEWSSPGAPGR